MCRGGCCASRTLHNFAVWRLVNYLLAYLDGEYAHKRNAFRKVMLGVSADKVRWNHCVELANKKMGMAVGALFIRHNFDPHSKETVRPSARPCMRTFLAP